MYNTWSLFFLNDVQHNFSLENNDKKISHDGGGYWGGWENFYFLYQYLFFPSVFSVFEPVFYFSVKFRIFNRFLPVFGAWRSR